MIKEYNELAAGIADVREVFAEERRERAEKKRNELLEKAKRKKEREAEAQKQDKEGSKDAIHYHNKLQVKGLQVLDSRLFTVDKIRKLL
eukprot:12461095-Ditylum_brightwellii.AAC.2